MRLAILAFALGVLILQCSPALPPLAPLVGVATFLAIMAWLIGVNCWRGRLLMACASLLLGAAWGAGRAELRLADALPKDREGQDVQVVGVVAELPQSFAYGTRFLFAVESMSPADAGVPPRIMLSWYAGRGGQGDAAGPPPLHPGERWQFTVRLKRPHGNANPFGFDYEAWLLERDIRATGYVRPGESRRLSAMVWQPALLIERLRDLVREHFRQMLPEADYPYSGILTALAIGDQRAIQGDLWNTFNRTGTTHLMSISGLHVTMVAALLGLAVGWLWRRSERLMLWRPAQQAAIVAAWVGALLYVLLSGFSVPAQRTLYMLSVAALALLSGRNPGASRTLAGALLVVLLIDPWAVLAAGFWLSFGAVGALLYIGQSGPLSGWRARIAAWGTVQWAATLASLPILLLVFQQFSLVSPLANAVAIPVVSFIVTPLALLAAVLPWWPIAWLAHAVLEALMVFLHWCAAWPVWQAPAPPWWAALAAGLGVLVMLLPRGMPGKIAGVLLLLPALFWPPPRPAVGEAWVEVLDVGQGLAVLVRSAGHTLLYDTGPLYSAESDAGQRIIVPYLRALGIDRLDALVVSHRDTDHSGGVASVRAAMPVAKVLSSMPELGEPCRAGQNWEWSGVRFAMLHPDAADAEANAAQKGKANHVSCVLRIEAGGRSLLLTADIEAADEAALLARDPAALRADVLLVPHHGSKSSSTPAFLDAVGATEAIVPAGYRNRFRHPRPEVLERYEERQMRIWRTDRDGALLLRMSKEGTQIRAWRAERRRYWLD